MLDAGDDTGFWAASSGGSGTKQGSPGLGAAICGTQPSVTTGEGRRGELTRLAAVSGRLAAGGRRGREPLGEGRDGRMKIGVLRLWMGQDPKFKRQPSKAEGEKRMGLLSLFFFACDGIWRNGETEEVEGWPTYSKVVQAAQTHTHIPLRSRAEVGFFLFKFDRGSDGPKRDFVLALPFCFFQSSRPRPLKFDFHSSTANGRHE